MKRNKNFIGVTKSVYRLCRVLEELEDYLEFSVFYSFAEILESRHYCPGFTYGEYYYEIQYDDSDNLHVLRWSAKSKNDAEGYVLTEKETEELITDLN